MQPTHSESYRPIVEWIARERERKARRRESIAFWAICGPLAVLLYVVLASGAGR